VSDAASTNLTQFAGAMAHRAQFQMRMMRDSVAFERAREAPQTPQSAREM